VEKNVLILALWPIFNVFFLQICHSYKTFSRNLSVCITDATFVPNLTFLGLLSPEKYRLEKKQSPTQTDTHKTPVQTPSLFRRPVNLNALRILI